MFSKMQKLSLAAFFLLVVCGVNGAAIWLDTNPPLPLLDPGPNEAITILVKTDAPLLAMNLKVCVIGDATIIDAMDETDGGAYGWNVGFVPLSVINPDNSVELYGVQFSTNTQTTVGYFRMYRNSGVVKVKIDLGFSQAFNWTETEFFFDPTTLYIGSIPAVEIYSDITVNQVWTADKAYYITSNPSDPNIQTINVQALLVIEPGTTVIYGANACLAVNNGGTLIANGTPDKPILFTPDYLHYLYPDSIGYYWLSIFTESVYYHCPIYVEETASPATTIRHCMMEGAVAGVVIQNIRLTNPIENNYFVGNGWGVFEEGPRLTDICNNLIFCNSDSGIEVFFVPDANTIADTGHPLSITGNTCDYNQFVGITVHGVTDPNTMPTVNLTNNIVTYHGYCGLNLVDYYMDAKVENTGYCGNENDTNWDFEQSNPITTEVYPYAPIVAFGAFEGGPLAHHYLAPDSVFVNGGTKLAVQTPLIGTTTQENGTPDKDSIDLGFHVLNWTYEGSEVVEETGLFDLAIMARHWMLWTPYEPNSPGYVDPNSPTYDPNDISFGGDWNDDGHVDLNDFVLLAGIWRKGFTQPNLVPVIEGDSNTGHVTVSASGYGPEISSIYAYLNGKIVGKVYDSGISMPKLVDLSESGPLSRLKFLVISDKGYYYYSALSDILYDSPILYCILPRSYDPNTPIPFSAITSGTGNTTVSAYADGGQLIWSQIFTGNTIQGSIPASAMTGHYYLESVQFNPTAAQSPPPPSAAVEKDTCPIINGMRITPDKKGLIIIADSLLAKHNSFWKAMQAFDKQGIKYLMLSQFDCTYENLSIIAKNANIKYIFFFGHGNYWKRIGREMFFRTTSFLPFEPLLSCKYSEFPNPPGWCYEFPAEYEPYYRTWASLGFQDIRLFVTAQCFGGRLVISPAGQLVEGETGPHGLCWDGPSDMSWALGLQNPTASRAYHAWWSYGYVGIGGIPCCHQEWIRNLWWKLGEGGSLYDALNYAIHEADNFSAGSAAYMYRLKGQGYLENIYLSN